MKNVYVVAGAPGSGKSTYVKGKVAKRDLVVDLDELARALRGNDELYGDNGAVLDQLLEVRRTLYDSIRARRGTWDNAYVITTSKHAKAVACDLRAELVQMDTSKEECRKRVMEDSRRSDKNKHLELIDEWFSEPNSPKSTSEQFADWFNSVR